MTNPKSEGNSPILDDSVSEIQDERQAKSSYKVMHGFQTVLGISIVMATLLTLWNPRKLLGTPNLNALIQAEITQGRLESETKEEDTRNHIGILAGHWQDNPGEVCADGLTEAEVNLHIANQTSQLLTNMGYQVDIFPEFDMGLLNYQSAVFIAIYSGSCADNPPPSSGFKIGTSLTTQDLEIVNNLAVCVSEAYREKTSLPYNYEVINPDHPAFHIFRDLDKGTPAIMIEAGSLNTDRIILTDKANLAAEGIVTGILCFLDSQNGTGQ